MDYFTPNQMKNKQYPRNPYVASNKEATLIGRIADIVQSGRGPGFVA